MREHGGPPRAALRLIERRLPPEIADAVAGDLEDDYRAVVRPRRGWLAADVWFWWQVLTLRGASLRRAHRRLRAVRPAGAAGPGGIARGPDLVGRVSEYGRDLRYSARRLLRAPGFSTVAILSLALGIGANSAMFSVVNAVLLRGLPLTDPDRLVEIYTSDTDGYPYSSTSYPDLVDLRAVDGVFEGVVGTRTFLARAGVGEVTRVAMGELVSWDYFDVLGVPPALGRSFLAEEEATPGTHPVTILGYRTWTEQYGADPAIVGRSVLLNGREYTVVGVAHPHFTGSIPVVVAGYFVPMAMTDAIMGADSGGQLERRSSRSTFVKGRLAEGVSLAQANAALVAASAALAATYPDSNEDRVITALASGDVSLHPYVDGMVTPVAVMLLSVVGLVLLIACANLASFLLARAEDRRREIAVRLALGAGRVALTRQLLMETTLLAVLGGVAGIVLAEWTLGMVLSVRPPLPIPLDVDVSIDGRVLAFTAVVSVLAGVAFGLTPALQATRPDVAPTLKGDGAGTRRRRRIGLRDGLVIAQVAFSFVLLIGAGLFVRSLQKAQAIAPGFYTGPAALLWPDVGLTGGMTRAEQLAFGDVLEERLLAEPTIDAVARADRLPLGVAVQSRRYLVPGVPAPDPERGHSIDNAMVSPSYFETLDVELVQGSGFSDGDVEGDPVVVVSQAFVDRFYPGEDVIGRVLERPGGSTLRIVGVARDTKVRTLGEVPRPYVYELGGQTGVQGWQYVIRGRGTSAELLATARRVLEAVDPDVPLLEAKTMNEHLSLLLFPPRMAALLLTVFGGLALLLSAIGIYGVVSYAVSKRTREMGIRISLGASAADVVRMAVGGGMRLVVVGGVLGLLLAGALAWGISGFLYGIGPNDVATFLTIPVVLSAVALFAAWVPARRASSVDPVRALRTE